MTDQTTPGADAGGNNDGFVDLDAMASVASDTNNDPIADSDGITDWDTQPAGDGKGNNAEVEPDKAKAAEAEAKAKEEETAKKRLSGNQRAKQQRNQLLDQIAERDRQIAELQKGGEKPAADAGPKPPKEEDFNGDWFAYQRALAAFDAGEAARKAANEVLKANETSAQRDRSAREARERSEAHIERVEAARDVIADFDAVMEGMKSVQVRDNTIGEIMSSDNSALIAYHFATNPDELTAFDSMTPREQAREIGRLEATLKMPEPKKATSAPPPLSKPKGGSTPRDQSADLNAWLDKKYGKNRPR